MVGSFVLRGSGLSPETQHTSADDYSPTSLAEWATIKDKQLCWCPSTHLLFRVTGGTGVSPTSASPGNRQEADLGAGEIFQST